MLACRRIALVRRVHPGRESGKDKLGNCLFGIFLIMFLQIEDYMSSEFLSPVSLSEGLQQGQYP